MTANLTVQEAQKWNFITYPVKDQNPQNHIPCSGADLGGGCKGCTPPPPPRDDLCFIGVEVEQETSAPPPKKNPGSAPAARSVAPYRPNKECPPGELFYFAGVFCRTFYTSLQLCRHFLRAHECFACKSAMLKLQKRGKNEASQKMQYRNQTFFCRDLILLYYYYYYYYYCCCCCCCCFKYRNLHYQP